MAEIHNVEAFLSVRLLNGDDEQTMNKSIKAVQLLRVSHGFFSGLYGSAYVGLSNPDKRFCNSVRSCASGLNLRHLLSGTPFQAHGWEEGIGMEFQVHERQ